MTRILKNCHSINDLRLKAKKILPRTIFDFVDGAADDEQTSMANETAFRNYGIIPRILTDVSQRDQNVTLFGHKLANPIIIAPTGLSGIVWPRGELEVAKATSRKGNVMIVSAAAAQTLEKIAQYATGHLWFQTFIYKDRAFTEWLLKRAIDSGYQALCVTVDVQMSGFRRRDYKNGFTIPPQIKLASILDAARRYKWWMKMARHPRVTFPNFENWKKSHKNPVSLAAYMNSLIDPSLTWKDFQWIRECWEGPLIIKGVLHPDDAMRAIELGANGVIVSNHGGRQLNGAISSLEGLTAIAAAVGNRAPVMFDGGVRSGLDAVLAIAKGAAGVLIGRPHIWGLAVGGEAGVVHCLEILRNEIDRTLALSGVQSISAVGPHLIDIMK